MGIWLFFLDGICFVKWCMQGLEIDNKWFYSVTQISGRCWHETCDSKVTQVYKFARAMIFPLSLTNIYYKCGVVVLDVLCGALDLWAHTRVQNRPHLTPHLSVTFYLYKCLWSIIGPKASVRRINLLIIILKKLNRSFSNIKNEQIKEKISEAQY